jgi:hypothetical protein
MSFIQESGVSISSAADPLKILINQTVDPESLFSLIEHHQVYETGRQANSWMC